MQYIGKSKIGSLSARKGVKYPQLRLPQQCADVIGHTADILETESEGKRAFLIVTDQVMPKSDIVLKQSDAILKPAAQAGIETHLATIESEIKELKSALLSNEDDRHLKTTKKDEKQMGSAGFEPATSAMSRRRHNQLDHEP